MVGRTPEFLGRKIEFLDIYKAIESAMDNHKILAGDNFENIKFADKEARDFVYKNFGGN